MSAGDLEGLALVTLDALFLDFDGTLAEIGPDPDAIGLPAHTSEVLTTLANGLGGAVAVISGRDLRDLAVRVPTGIWRLGGHGLEVLSPGEDPPPAPPPPPEALMRPLRKAATRPGVRLEIKGPVVALHFRAAPSEGPACLAAAAAAARLWPGYMTQNGKMVVEVKPEAAHKGSALRRMSQEAPFLGRRPIMVGDDATDEDAMRAAVELGGVAVKVGDGATVASLRAPTPSAVRAWLEREASRLTTSHPGRKG